MSVVDVPRPKVPLKRTLELRESHRIHPGVALQQGSQSSAVDLGKVRGRSDTHAIHRFAEVGDEAALSFVNGIRHGDQRPAILGAGFRRSARRTGHGPTVDDSGIVARDPMRATSNSQRKYCTPGDIYHHFLNPKEQR